MAISSFAVMNPTAAMSMIDTSRWRTVVYADTPKSLVRYKEFLDQKKTDARKVVCFVFGVTSLKEVLKNQDKFNSILIFDDLQNLSDLRTQLGVQIADVKETDASAMPKHLTPQEMNTLVESSSPALEISLLKKVLTTLGPRRPSVLETTSRIPAPLDVEESGSQRLLTEIKQTLPDPTFFGVVATTYCKYLFRMIDRNTVTQTVTKKLPAEAKDFWKKALDYADSDIGLAMHSAFAKLCSQRDPDYRTGHAVAEFNLKLYSGDFLYFTMIIPPFDSCQFLQGTTAAASTTAASTANSWTPPPELPATVKSKGKKAKSKT